MGDTQNIRIYCLNQKSACKISKMDFGGAGGMAGMIGGQGAAVDFMSWYVFERVSKRAATKSFILSCQANR